MTLHLAQIKRCLLQKVQERGRDKSICPSEVARAIGGEDWRTLMPGVRSVGAELVALELVIALQRLHSQ